MEATQAKWFEAHFGCTLKSVTDQKCGCARDYKIVGLDENTELPGELNSFVEFKFDYKASKTGNLYLEYEQTFDFGKNYLSKQNFTWHISPGDHNEILEKKYGW